MLLVLEQFWCGLSRLLYVTSWNDSNVAELVNGSYIPVRVDADRRPDVDHRYTVGSWPAVVFLTPDLKPILGTGFVPPDVLLDALGSIAAMYRENQAEITDRVAAVEEQAELYESARIDASRSPSPWMTGRILDMISDTADTDFGGFGQAPKFPHFDALELLLEVHQRAAQEKLQQQKKLIGLAVSALDAMMQNGLYDWEDGGFFRCSDEPDWSSPRLEKLLCDQSRHVHLFLLAHENSGDVEYREAAEGTVDYMFRMLHDPASGCFHSSQAADPEYYQMSRGEREKAARPAADPTTMAGSQCRAVRALLYAAPRLGQSTLAGQTLRALDVLLERLCPDDGLAFHYWNGAPRVRGLLADQAEIGLALLDAAAASGGAHYADRALALGGRVHELLFDPRQAGYFDAADPLGLGLLGGRSKSFDGNTGLAVFFGRLADATGDEKWRARAVTALAGFTGVWDRLGVSSAKYGLGLLHAFGGG